MKREAVTADSRLLTGFLEIADFVQAHGREPERTLTDMTGDVTSLTLTALGASLVHPSTIRALSASATAVTGAKASFDSNLFYEKTMPALFAQMEANRAIIRPFEE